MEIKKFNDQYEKTIKQKIEEAYNIKDQIIYEMNKIINEINQKIILLIEETRELIENVNKNKQKLEEEQSELKKKLVLRQTLGILKIVAQTISVVSGPIGIAGIATTGGVNIAKAFISEDNKNKPNFEISPDIKNSLKNMEEMVRSEENEIMIAKQQLKKLSYECNKYSGLSNIKVNLITIQNKLSNIDFTTTIVKEIKDELVQTQTKLEELKKKIEMLLLIKKQIMN
ncbi:hypothetical protein C2G38_2040441 [Gigaspora rosea]|uniref:Uncharacterized protein n=1 Tax=Gigaspora rosea TaxID=44941 RepID=A0A397UXN4_9GLOM|nr:hypothetical protein C2G38_2040441 [Gigaspora rosea]